MTLTETGQVQTDNGQAHGVANLVTPRKTDTVAIIGFAEGHRDAAPWDDDTVERWGMNRLWSVTPGRTFSRWFELHSLSKFYADDEDHKKFLRQFPGPVYVRPEDVDLALAWGIKNAEPFPKAYLLSKFPSYFTNTVSWLLALAIVMEYTKIQVFGVDMAQDHLIQSEYQEQRPSCEYFLGIAMGAGIAVELPEGCDLLKSSHLYGFEDPSGYSAKLISRLEELGRRKEQAKAQLAQLEAQKVAIVAAINQFDGAMQQCQYDLKNLMPMPEAIQ